MDIGIAEAYNRFCVCEFCYNYLFVLKFLYKNRKSQIIYNINKYNFLQYY